jgi:hypothetical protein
MVTVDETSLWSKENRVGTFWVGEFSRAIQSGR